MARLRDFAIGDTVVLKGAGTEKVPPLFLGGINGDYRLLYKSEKDCKEGKLWQHAASGSHEAIAA